MANVHMNSSEDKVEEQFATLLTHLKSITKHTKKLLDLAMEWRSSRATEGAAQNEDLAAVCKSHSKSVTKFVQGVEDDSSACASIVTYLRHQHRRKKEQARQIKIMSDPKLHVPSRRTKIIAHRLSPGVSFEQLKQLAKSKLQGNISRRMNSRKHPRSDGHSQDDEEELERQPTAATVGQANDSESAAAGSSNGIGAAHAQLRVGSPAHPSAATVRKRRAKRQRVSMEPDADGDTTATVEAIAAKAAQLQNAPRHPGRTPEQQQRMLELAIAQELQSNGGSNT